MLHECCMRRCSALWEGRIGMEGWMDGGGMEG